MEEYHICIIHDKERKAIENEKHLKVRTIFLSLFSIVINFFLISCPSTNESITQHSHVTEREREREIEVMHGMAWWHASMTSKFEAGLYVLIVLLCYDHVTHACICMTVHVDPHPLSTSKLKALYK